MRASQYHALLVKQAEWLEDHPPAPRSPRNRAQVAELLAPLGFAHFTPEEQESVLNAPPARLGSGLLHKTAGKSEGDKNWKTMPGVRAVVLDDKARVLLLKRPAHEVFHPNTWNLPGGDRKSVV